MAPSTPMPPALVTAATTSRQWVKAKMGNSMPELLADLGVHGVAPWVVFCDRGDDAEERWIGGGAGRLGQTRQTHQGAETAERQVVAHRVRCRGCAAWPDR